MNEYDSLRNEIISQLSTKRNIWMYMYTLYLTIFVIGIEVSYNLLLVTYIVIIPFQSAINSHARAIRVAAAYIRLKYENENSGFDWEKFHISSEYKNFQKMNYHGAKKVLHMGSVQLGILTTISFIFFKAKDAYNNNIFLMSKSDIALIALSIILLYAIYI